MEVEDNVKVTSNEANITFPANFNAIQSDFDFAYHLQLQEAKFASLALLPSSSRFRPQPNDDVLGLAMLRNKERFAQELEDREQSEAEMKLVADILHIPEEECKIFVDKYHIPHGTDTASSSSSTSYSSSSIVTERFKVYFKGLVSKERVGDRKVVVAGAGVAIGDPKDNLILEVQKNLEASGDGEELSDDVPDLQTLFLMKADLEALPPQQRMLKTLVNKVVLLQRKFIKCEPSLVALDDIKFAFKFAKAAIVSQVTRRAESVKGKKSFKETCLICYEDTDVDRMFSVDVCLHRYCFSCMKKHLEVKLLDGKMGNCPHVGCKSEVNIESYAKFLDPKLVEVFRQRMKESSIPVTEKVYCPYPRCSAFSSKTELLQYNLKYVNSGARKCIKCHYYFCINCKVPWHYDMTCNDYKSSNPHPEDTKLKSLATEQQWRQCGKCNHMVELALGCNHITCRCGNEFCYTCGAKWENKKATCSCPIWDERNIIRDVR